MSYCRVLAMDGGGIHGLLTALLLKRIEEVRPGFLAKVDVFAGTSAGGIMALMLAAADEPAAALKACIELWTKRQVFTNTPVGTLMSITGTAAVYSNRNLRTALQQYFGSRTLSDLRSRVVIPSFELDNKATSRLQRNWQPRIFHNFGENLDTHVDAPALNQRLVDVALRTSAAPINFPVYQGFVDGGVYANNPSMCALAVVLDRSGSESTEERPLPESPDEVILLSMGTGRNRHYSRVGTANWGWANWLLDVQQPLRLLDVVMDSGGEIVDYQCENLLGDNLYHRLDPDLLHPVSMADDGRSIPMLTEVALDTDLTDTYAWLDASPWFTGVVSEEAAGNAPRRRARRRRRGGGQNPASEAGG